MACKICGEKSGYMPLCNNCFKLRDEGKVIKCEECNTWHLIDKPCQCTQKQSVTINENEPLTNCIICKANASGYLFCKECYRKYKNKELLIKITKCTELELLDDSYEGKYVCKDGHVVKSKSEREIDNYLYDNKITHAYEKPFSIDGNPDNDLHPDFYLPELDVFIEHWGYDETNKEYTKTKEYKLKLYKEKKVTLINLYEKTDAKDIEASLKRKLNNFEKGKINFDS